MSREYNNHRPGGYGREPAHDRQYRGYDDRRAYENYSRAPPPPPQDYRRPPSPRGFNFRGAADSSRGQPYQFGGGDNYRGGDAYPPRSFDFRASGVPTGPAFPEGRQNDYRPNRKPRSDNRKRGPYRPPPGASKRAILNTKRSPTPEQLKGMNQGESRFKVLGDLSEEEGGSDKMNEDDNESLASKDGITRGENGRASANVQGDDSDDDEHPRAKRVRLSSPKQNSDAPSSSVVEPSAPRPQWSNPDPYTALPPPGESAKTKDVLGMIRKAKVDGQLSGEPKATSTDFISLNFDDEDLSEGEEGEVTAIEEVSSTPVFSHLNNLHPERRISGSRSNPVSLNGSDPPDMSAANGSRTNPISVPDNINTVKLDVWPPPADPGNQAGFGRAVMRQENAALATQPVKSGKKRKHDSMRDAGDIAELWRAATPQSSTPWHTKGHITESEADSELWLHQEILEFYDFVKPHRFEEEVRKDLIARIEQACRTTMPWITIEAFGSYASGLYLPTADMDLVAISNSFRSRGMPSVGMSGNQMRKFGDMLTNANLVKPWSMTVIAKAKVPIIKFVEKTTGLRVDISFDNMSGVHALPIFDKWTDQYRAMPFIVALIKQYLAMRDLSEVVNGGLGGFSIICLVVFTIRRLEDRKGPGYARSHLDETLCEFFNYWGKSFNLRTQGLDMNRLMTVPKTHFTGKPSKPERLLIIDPNNAQNDISGGSSSVELIFDMFASAHNSLMAAMEDAEEQRHEMHVNDHRSSLLKCLWGGNYESFMVQRDRMQELWHAGYRQEVSEPAIAPPPPPPVENMSFKAPTPVQSTPFQASGPPRESGYRSWVDLPTKNAEPAKAPQAPTAPKAPKEKKNKKRKSDEAGLGQQTGPGAASTQAVNKAPLPKKAKKSTVDVQADKQRSDAFKKEFPGVSVPNHLTKSEHRRLTKEVKDSQDRANKFKAEHPGVQVGPRLTKKKKKVLTKKLQEGKA